MRGLPLDRRSRFRSARRCGTDRQRRHGRESSTSPTCSCATSWRPTARPSTPKPCNYPAAPVPLEGGLGGWLDFLDSVKDGTNAAEEQFEAFTAKCPDTKVVLAGYSQGAMVIHRNLYDLADDPHVAAALLIADGDRLPVDTTIDLGSTAIVPGTGQGVGQEHSFLASTDTSKLPPEIGARTISVCDVGDPVCDYNPDTTELSAADLAIHTSYAPTASGPHAWGAPLYTVVASNPPAVSTELTAQGA